MNKAIKNKIYVWICSDVHWGSVHCDKRKFLQYIQWAKDTPNVRIFLLGDLIENAITTHIPEAMFDQDTQPKTQLDEIIEIFKPLRSKIDFCVVGNHELRTYYKTGFDPTEILSTRLNIPYRQYGGYHLVKAGKQEYLFAFHHGASAALGNARLDLDKLRKIYPDAEIFCCGHNHMTYAQQFVVRSFTTQTKEKFVEKKIWYVRSGSFINYADYAHRKLYEPQATGSSIVKLYTNQHLVDVSTSDKIGSGFMKKTR